MTRPEVRFDGYNVDLNAVYWYDVNNVLQAVYSPNTSNYSRNLGRKLASVSTIPTDRGGYAIPTEYYAHWGFWTSSSGGQVFVDGYPSPPNNYRAEFVGHVLGDIGYLPFSRYTKPSWVQNKLEITALNKLRNVQANYGVMLGEAKETAHLFTTTATRIAKSVTQYRSRYPLDFLKAAELEGSEAARLAVNRKLQKRGLGPKGSYSRFDTRRVNKLSDAEWYARRKSLKDKIPQSWLELQYGWKPLMSDILDSCSAVDFNLVRHEDAIVAVKAGTKTQDTIETDLFWSPGYARTVLQTSVESKYKIKLTYSLDNFHTATLSSLGLTNPAEIVWELVPYSFVVDWFLPVGNWLSALGGDFGCTFVNGYFSEFHRMVDRDWGSFPSPSYARPLGPSIKGYAGYFYRHLYHSSPWPGLYFKSPVSPGHIANAMSLLSQAFLRRAHVR